MMVEPLVKPRRPLSGYNIFFQLERDRIVNGEMERSFTVDDVSNLRLYAPGEKRKRSDRKVHGKISFEQLAKHIASKWRRLHLDEKMIFESRSQVEKAKYQHQLKEWKKSEAWIHSSKTQATKHCLKGICELDGPTLSEVYGLSTVKPELTFATVNCLISPLPTNESLNQLSSEELMEPPFLHLHSYTMSQNGFQHATPFCQGNQLESLRINSRILCNRGSSCDNADYSLQAWTKDKYLQSSSDYISSKYKANLGALPVASDLCHIFMES